MKKIPEPIFSSQELQNAVESARPIIEGLEEAQDRVSNDIKALESYFQSLDLKDPFRHPLGKSFLPAEGEGQFVAASLEFSGSASGHVEEEALLWDQDTHGRFRLLFELSKWEGCIEIDVPGGPYFCEESTLERQRKPLIETKFEIRKRLYPHLPEFVRGLAKHLAVDQQKNLDELPF